MKKTEMQPACVVEIVTPKRFLLKGLWFGSSKPKRVIIFVHGLGGSVFSMNGVVNALVDTQTSVVAFNNRGFGQINVVKRKSKRGTGSIVAGAGHEVFTDSVDDIQGAVNFVRRLRIREIYIAGHSTGCQKAVFWASRKGKGVRGIILLAPVSDWAAEVMLQGEKRINQTVAVARTFVRSGRRHDLLPKGKVTKRHEAFDAQRILSLYTPDSIEEIFPYAQSHKNPRVLHSVRIPVLVLWAQKDEFGDRPVKDIEKWFEKHLQKGKVAIIPRVKHSFRGGEKVVAREIKRFIGN